jgi:hypothetical protein
MLFAPRKIAVAVLVAGGLTVLTAPASHAVVDPAMMAACLTGSAADATSLVDPSAVAADPASLAAPPEVPAVHCIAL